MNFGICNGIENRDINAEVELEDDSESLARKRKCN